MQIVPSTLIITSSWSAARGLPCVPHFSYLIWDERGSAERCHRRRCLIHVLTLLIRLAPGQRRGGYKKCKKCKYLQILPFFNLPIITQKIGKKLTGSVTPTGGISLAVDPSVQFRSRRQGSKADDDIYTKKKKSPLSPAANPRHGIPSTLGQTRLLTIA